MPPEKAAMVSPEDKARVDMLHIHVNGFVPSAHEEVVKTQLKMLEDSFLAACTDQTVLHYAVETLMEKCIENRPLSDKVAILFSNLFDLVIGEAKLRSVILSCLQNNFLKLTELQETSNARWLNSIALFVAIFHRFRFACGQPLFMLVPYVIEALQPLLSGDEAEMKLLAESVISNGCILKMGNPEGFEQLLLDIRSTLIQRNLSTECRLWLLLTADAAEMNFQPLRPTLLNFYKEHLGDGILPILENGTKNTYTNNLANPAESVPSADPADNANPATPVSPIFPTPPAAELRQSPPSSAAERNERRGGAKLTLSARSKDGLVDKVQNFRISTNEKSQNFSDAIASYGSSSKGKAAHWGHDDRFENDYENPRPRPERSQGKKSFESPEKADRSNRAARPEQRTRIPDGNWRQSGNNDLKDKSAGQVNVSSTEEVWD